jgi:hypothetical protein
MMTEVVLETSVSFIHLTRLIPEKILLDKKFACSAMWRQLLLKCHFCFSAHRLIYWA